MTGVPWDDRGLLLGDGLFETLLAQDGRLVNFPAHLARMEAGCDVLGLPPPDADQARALCFAALDEAGLALGRAAVRLTLTAGSGGRGLDRPPIPKPRLRATAAPAPETEGPVHLRLARVRRNEGSPASRLKTLSYLDNLLARREAAPHEALMLDNAGHLACAAAANLFWVSGGRLLTPALDCGVLPGSIRAAILDWAPGQGLEVVEARDGLDALRRAEGVFLTNSLIGVRAVASLDGQALARSPLTDRVAGVVRALNQSW